MEQWRACLPPPTEQGDLGLERPVFLRRPNVVSTARGVCVCTGRKRMRLGVCAARMAENGAGYTELVMSVVILRAREAHFPS